MAQGRDGESLDSLVERMLSRSYRDDYDTVLAAAVFFPDSVPGLIRVLQRGNEAARSDAAAALGYAATWLGKSPDPRAMEPLLAAARDRSPDVRLGAVLALERYRGERVVDALVQALPDTDEQVRKAAATSLVPQRDPRALGALVRAAANLEFHPSTTEPARKAIAAIGAPAVEELIVYLASDDYATACVAANALAEIGDERAVASLAATVALPNRISAIQHYAADALVRFGPAAVPALASALRDPRIDDAGRYAAVSALGKTGDLRACDLLVATLLKGSADLRVVAAHALGELRDTNSVDALLVAIKSDDSRLRFAAALALHKLKDERSSEPMVALFEDPSTDVRRVAVGAVGELAADRYADRLVPRLADVDISVRVSAATVLVNVEHPDLLEIMFAALEDERSGIQEMACAWLVRHPSEAIDRLVAVVRTPNPDYESRQAARRTAEAKADEDARLRGEPFFRCGNEPAPPPTNPRIWAAMALTRMALSGNWSADGVEALISVLESEDSWLRSESARALCVIVKPPGPSYEPTLEQLASEDPVVRTRAVEQLRQILAEHAISGPGT
jgi:HEAT repeat protein